MPWQVERVARDDAKGTVNTGHYVTDGDVAQVSDNKAGLGARPNNQNAKVNARRRGGQLRRSQSDAAQRVCRATTVTREYRSGIETSRLSGTENHLHQCCLA